MIKFLKIISLFIIPPLFLLFLWFFSLDYGISYDESIHKNYGYFIYFYLSTFGKNPIALSYLNLPYYGGTYDFYSFVFTSFMQKTFNQNYLYEYRHFFNGLIASISYFSIYYIGKTLHSKLLGLLSVICLLLIPEYMGHSFMNPKDIPFASFYTLSILILSLYVSKPKSRILFFMLTIAIGLTIGVRILGILLWINYFFLEITETLKKEKQKRDYKNFYKKILLLGLLSYFIAISTWPFLLKNPVKGAYLTLKTMSDFPWAGDMKVLGELYKPADLGRIYIYIMFLYTLPDFILGIILITIISLVYFFIKKDFSWLNKKVHILMMGTLLPLFLITVSGSTLYNGYRQVFFIIPSFIVLFLYLIFKFFEAIRSKVIILGSAIILFVLMIDTGNTMYQMHPYEYIYFNRLFSGGMEKGSKLFDVDYWSIGFKEASEYMLTIENSNQKPYKISNSATPEQTDYYLNREAYSIEENIFLASMKNLNSSTINDIKIKKYLQDYHIRNYTITPVKYAHSKDSLSSDFFISDTIIRNKKEFIGDPIYTIERLSIPICSIYQKKEESTNKPSK